MPIPQLLLFLIGFVAGIICSALVLIFSIYVIFFYKKASVREEATALLSPRSHGVADNINPQLYHSGRLRISYKLLSISDALQSEESSEPLPGKSMSSIAMTLRVFLSHFLN